MRLFRIDYWRYGEEVDRWNDFGIGLLNRLGVIGIVASAAWCANIMRIAREILDCRRDKMSVTKSHDQDDKNQKPVYFSKIQFTEKLRNRSILFVNVEEGEVSYQRYRRKPLPPSIKGTKSERFMGEDYHYDFNAPGVFMRNTKTDFNAVMLEEADDEYVVFSYGIKLSEEEHKELLKYCNALEFEPYRNREMSMKDAGYCGYRDEISVSFVGVTDSYIPKLELPMEYYYDEEHEWPQERLYRYLVNKLSTHKKMKNTMYGYGSFSLPF